MNLEQIHENATTKKLNEKSKLQNLIIEMKMVDANEILTF